MPRLVPVCLFLVFIGFTLVPSVAWSAPPAGLGDNGPVAAFAAGDYQAALTLYEEALGRGQNTGALHYNMGVCLYRLGRYPEAEIAFLKTAAFPAMAQLAYYNLGLVALRLDDLDKAARWFEDARDATGDEKISSLAALALAGIEEESGGAAEPVWLRFGSISMGYDDNVELATDADGQTASEQGDGFAELLGYVTGPLTGSPEKGVQLQANAYYLKYGDLSEYDVGSFGFGLAYTDQLRDWSLETGADYTYTMLDTENLEQVPTLSFQLRRPLNRTATLRFRYGLSYLDQLDDTYAYLEGWRQRLLAESVWQWAMLRATLGYTFEWNDRDDPDYSPTRHSLAAGLTVHPLQTIDIHFGFDYRASLYDTTLIDQRDHENRLKTRLRLTYGTGEAWSISTEYEHTENDSNDPVYDYSRNVVLLNASMSF